MVSLGVWPDPPGVWLGQITGRVEKITRGLNPPLTSRQFKHCGLPCISSVLSADRFTLQCGVLLCACRTNSRLTSRLRMTPRHRQRTAASTAGPAAVTDTQGQTMTFTLTLTLTAAVISDCHLADRSCSTWWRHCSWSSGNLTRLRCAQGNSSSSVMYRTGSCCSHARDRQMTQCRTRRWFMISFLFSKYYLGLIGSGFCGSILWSSVVIVGAKRPIFLLRSL